jgi:spermidine synthase
MMNKEQSTILLASLLLLSACAILYELLISTVSTYLLGSSILHFSITIGLFLSFLGVGSWLSKFLNEPLLERFILIELLLGLVGGFSALVLYLGNAYFDSYYGLLLLTTASVGTLAGMEIPILTRLLEKTDSLRSLIAHVLTFDYLGALVASLLFPLLLLPIFGTMRTAFIVGLINWSVAVFNLYIFKNELKKALYLRLFSIFIGISLLLGFLSSFELMSFADELAYQDDIILTKQTPYQRMVVTQWNNDLRLYLNGNLQFSSVDEYRYHEALIFIPMMAAHKPDMNVLILGGGDGLALRDMWKTDTFLQKKGLGSIKHVDLVDLDEEMVSVAKTNPFFTSLNQRALEHPKVTCHYQDAFVFVKNCSTRYDVIIIDLPDPSEPALGKLYGKEFYTMLRQCVAADGVLVTQSTSPFFAREPFWCINHTLKSVFPKVIPYHAHVPSFGDWGFNMAFAQNSDKADAAFLGKRLSEILSDPAVPNYPKASFCRFLNEDNVKNCFQFDKDTEDVPSVPINTLESMSLITLYDKSFRQFH